MAVLLYSSLMMFRKDWKALKAMKELLITNQHVTLNEIILSLLDSFVFLFKLIDLKFRYIEKFYLFAV